METYRILVVDDERVPAAVHEGCELSLYKTSTEALEALAAIHDNDDSIDELWLDYSLAGSDDIYPVLTWLVRSAEAGAPLRVGSVHAHTSAVSGQALIVSMLRPHYNVMPDRLPQEKP